jgi:hypothetical protein
VAQLAHTDAPAIDNFPVPHVIHALWPAEPWYLRDKYINKEKASSGNPHKHTAVAIDALTSQPRSWSKQTR